MDIHIQQYYSFILWQACPDSAPPFDASPKTSPFFYIYMLTNTAQSSPSPSISHLPYPLPLPSRCSLFLILLLLLLLLLPTRRSIAPASVAQTETASIYYTAHHSRRLNVHQTTSKVNQKTNPSMVWYPLGCFIIYLIALNYWKCYDIRLLIT